MPLAGEDLALLEALAAACAELGRSRSASPCGRTGRSSTRSRSAGGRPLLADTVTDVLRLAAAVSGGDVTLETATRFRSFARPERRVLMAALDSRRAGRARPSSPTSPGTRSRGSGSGSGCTRTSTRGSRTRGGCSRSRAARSGSRRWRRGPSRRFRVGRDRAGGAAAGRRARPALPVAGPAAAQRDPGGPRGDHGPRRAGRAVCVRAGAAVGAGAFPEPGRRRRGRACRGSSPTASGRAWVAPEARAGLDQGTRRDVLALLDEAVAARLPEGGRLIVDPARARRGAAAVRQAGRARASE